MVPDVTAGRNNHIILLHLRYQERCLALLRSEKKVTVCTTEIDIQSPILKDDNHNLHFISSWKYLPDCFFGYLDLIFFQLLYLQIQKLPQLAEKQRVLINTYSLHNAFISPADEIIVQTE